MVAVYAPATQPGGPTPSGEQTILRNTVGALKLAGFAPVLVSGLRLLDREGDSGRQSELRRAAEAEAERLVASLRCDPPALWYTYQSWYRCPDMVGPPVARALRIPYVIQQPSISWKRMTGPWACFARAALAGMEAADLLFWTTRRDLPALREAGLDDRLVELPPVIEPGPHPARRGAHRPLRLLTVAMMRDGVKRESYLRLAVALRHLELDWRLSVVGDGPARASIVAALAPFGDRVLFTGALPPHAVANEYARTDLLVWPGVGEGIGMAYLEAQAAGVPVIAEDHPAQRDVVHAPLVPPGDAAAFAAAIAAAAADRSALSAAARARIEARHTPQAAAAVLRNALARVIA